MSLQRPAQDHPVLVADGMTAHVQIHQAPVVGECPVQDSHTRIICPIKKWLETGHTTVTCQCIGEKLTVNVAPIQIDWASVAMEALNKGTCCIIRQTTKANSDLHVKS
jgi:hypothetical protein